MATYRLVAYTPGKQAGEDDYVKILITPNWFFRLFGAMEETRAYRGSGADWYKYPDGKRVKGRMLDRISDLIEERWRNTL